jgi:hypothetical protein
MTTRYNEYSPPVAWIKTRSFLMADPDAALPS